MSYRFSFPKDIRVSVAVSGRALLAVAYQGPGGRVETFGPCDDRTATLAMSIVMRLCDGANLDDAAAGAKQQAAEFDARLAAETPEPERTDP